MADPAFARLMVGYTFAGLGHQFVLISLMWLVLDLTDSGAALGLVVISMQLPGFVSSPVFGQLLDRVQPRTILIFDNALRALIITLMPILYWLDWLSVPSILVLSVAAGLLSPATTIGIQVLLPELVQDRDLDNANALVSLGLNLSFFLGPVIAGLLISLWGGPVAILIGAGSFAIMALLSGSLPIVERAVRAAPSMPDSERAWLGFTVLRLFPPVLVLTLMTFVFNFSYGPLEPALPLYARDTLQTGATGYGLLWTGMGAGIFFGLAAVPFVSRVGSQGIVLAIIAILWGVFLIPLAFITNVTAAVIMLGLAGMVWAPYSTMKNTLIQRLVPPDLRGKVFGIQYMVTVIGSPLGAVVGGLLLGILSAPQVIGISGLACIVAGGAGLLSPALRSVRREYAVVAGQPGTG